MPSKINITLGKYSETLRVINEMSFFTIWQSSPTEASELFVKFVHTGWKNFTKDKMRKETCKVRNFFRNKKISNVEGLRSSYGEALEDSSSVVLGSGKIKEVKCKSDDSNLEGSKQLKVKKGNQPIKSVPELEQNLHIVSNFFFYNILFITESLINIF